MGVGADERCPLPTDQLLADMAAAMEQSGHAAWILDPEWNFAYVTDDARAIWTDKAGGLLGSCPIGHHVFSTEALRVGRGWRFGLTTTELWRGLFRSLGGIALTDTPGGRDELRARIDPALHDLVDQVEPIDSIAGAFRIEAMGIREPIESVMTTVRIRGTDGALHGTVVIGKPAASMSVLGGLVWARDLGHEARMQRFTTADRHPTAILFADIEKSAALVRALPTKAYFNLGRRLVRAADQCVVDQGGVIGRHLGDGVVAYFPAVTSGSDSAAARACIQTAHQLNDQVAEIAMRSEIDPEALSLRFGLHWGSTAFIGNISTSARTEVTALGDEVNEAARLEQSAGRGGLLASKLLIERLNEVDAAAVGIDPGHVSYEQLAELETATPKARRDAPVLAVCHL